MIKSFEKPMPQAGGRSKSQQRPKRPEATAMASQEEKGRKVDASRSIAPRTRGRQSQGAPPVSSWVTGTVTPSAQM